MENIIKMLQLNLINAPAKEKCTDLENKMFDGMEKLLENLQKIKK